MRFSTSTVVTLAALIPLIGHAYTQPAFGLICDDIDGNGVLDLSVVSCSSDSDATENCNNMCWSAQLGCHWGRTF